MKKQYRPLPAGNTGAFAGGPVHDFTGAGYIRRTVPLQGWRILEDASSEVFSYILCSICPVKMTQPALSYFASDNQLHNRTADWIVSCARNSGSSSLLLMTAAQTFTMPFTTPATRRKTTRTGRSFVPIPKFPCP